MMCICRTILLCCALSSAFYGFSCADQIITTNLSASYPFISWPGNVTIDCALEQQNIIFECITLNCFHPPVLFIGESRENAVDYHAVHDCIWGRPPSATREEGIWILRKTLSVQDIVNASARVKSIQPELIQVWCDIGDVQTEKGYIHLMNLPTQHSTSVCYVKCRIRNHGSTKYGA